MEDLLRRLPGIEVESDGSIQADGKAVNRVTVDGKSFFGSDPKAATKNLPAEGVSKVQVFDTKTEQEEITGKTGDSEDKTMNLEMKEEFKKGGFGKVVAGYGDADRKELKGNYNKFNNKIQFSLVGVGNNTGRNGLSWDDYQDFMGSQSWNWDSGTDYGFGGRGFMRYMSNGDDGIETSIRSLFFSGERAGLPENYSAGVNFNYDHNKTKLSSVYYFNQTGLIQKSDMEQDKFYQAFTQNEEMASTADDISRGHRAEIEFEKELDTLHTIKASFNGAIIDDNSVYNSNSSLSRDNRLTSQSVFNNRSNTTGSLFNGLLLFRKKFQKKGRKFGVNTSILKTNLENDWNQDSNTDFYNDLGEVDSTLNINQDNLNIGDKTVFKANALYVEPLNKKFFIQTFYNFRNRVEDGERKVNDLEDGTETLNDFLSRRYDNTIQFQRGGTALRYSHNGINITAGAAYQHFDLQGEYNAVADGSSLGTVDNQFGNFIPHLTLTLNPQRNTYMSISYTRTPNEPSIRDLAPLVDNINPLFVKVGNADLAPEIANSVGIYASRNWPMHDLRININSNQSIHETQFSTEETVDENLVTTYKPILVEGGYNSWQSVRVSFPIKKNKIKVRASYSLNLNFRNSIVNAQDNQTQVISHRPGLKLDITPSEHMSLYLEGRYNIANTSYDINTSQDQKTQRTTFSAEFNSKLVAGIFISSKLSYNRYENDRFGQDFEIPIWNTSLYRHFMPGNQLEVRISLYDSFNKNIGFNQSAYGVGISQSSTESIGRYGMLSLTYNIRGIKSDVRKDSWW